MTEEQKLMWGRNQVCALAWGLIQVPSGASKEGAAERIKLKMEIFDYIKTLNLNIHLTYHEYGPSGKLQQEYAVFTGRDYDLGEKQLYLGTLPECCLFILEWEEEHKIDNSATT